VKAGAVVAVVVAAVAVVPLLVDVLPSANSNAIQALAVAVKSPRVVLVHTTGARLMLKPLPKVPSLLKANSNSVVLAVKDNVAPVVNNRVLRRPLRKVLPLPHPPRKVPSLHRPLPKAKSPLKLPPLPLLKRSPKKRKTLALAMLST